ncbi:hypothetical protein [Candidatus Aquicultor secundus]|uniref:hypothetical protein n=1 Tax=Candidatus Aquicultor secundus TaxID=1973895 RepID=UPI00257FD2AA|nr:hypothetical protein [Candidatus Aquicultor secundus]NCO66805.1 hypothetical protein [Solirubrobacter sp.]
MFKRKAKVKKLGSDNWSTWSSIASEGKKVNNHVSKESEQMVTRIDCLIDSIKETKVA